MKRGSLTMLQRTLLAWYDRQGRDLPWRHTTDPYAIAVSEVMLQQTQVDRVIPKYHAWLKRFPTVRSLAKAPLQDVLRLWSGLGYNSRAVRLREMARTLMARFGGRMPTQLDELRSLPGFGPYTAGAVAAFAFNRPVGMIDTNVRRTLGRIFFGSAGAPNDRELLPRVEQAVPLSRPAAWNHALMDLGATICVSRRPKCEICPVRSQCRAYPAILRHEPNEASRKTVVPFRMTDRFWRGRIIAIVLEAERLSVTTLRRRLTEYGALTAERFARLLNDLVREKLVRRRGSLIVIAA